MVLLEKQTDRQTDRIESPETNSHEYGQIISNKGAKNI